MKREEVGIIRYPVVIMWQHDHVEIQSLSGNLVRTIRVDLNEILRPGDLRNQAS